MGPVGDFLDRDSPNFSLEMRAFSRKLIMLIDSGSPCFETHSHNLPVYDHCRSYCFLCSKSLQSVISTPITSPVQE